MFNAMTVILYQVSRRFHLTRTPPPPMVCITVTSVNPKSTYWLAYIDNFSNTLPMENGHYGLCVVLATFSSNARKLICHDFQGCHYSKVNIGLTHLTMISRRALSHYLHTYAINNGLTQQPLPHCIIVYNIAYSLLKIECLNVIEVHHNMQIFSHEQLWEAVM